MLEEKQNFKVRNNLSKEEQEDFYEEKNLVIGAGQKKEVEQKNGMF